MICVTRPLAARKDVVCHRRKRQHRAACAPLGLLLLATNPGSAWAQMAPTTSTQTLTGTSSDTGFPVTVSIDGTRTYGFNDGDTITTKASGVQDIQAIDVLGGPKTIFQVDPNGTGTLNVATSRPAVGKWGVAIGMAILNGANVTVNGATSVYATSGDADPLSAALGIKVSQAAATFNGPTKIVTYTPGYSQGLWVYQGAVVFNGTLDVQTQARGASTAAIYNSGGGRSSIVVNGDANLVAAGLHPSDNVQGIYNDGINSKLTVTGNLSIAASSTGSTAMGVRNQGNLYVGGNATIVASGPRTVWGFANTHRTARAYVGGDMNLTVNNWSGYTPFGLPTGLSNTYGRASYMTLAGGVNITVNAAAESYAVNNSGVFAFSNAAKVALLRVNANCTACDVYGVRNASGAFTAAGGLDVAAATTGTGRVYGIWNVADGDVASVMVNQAGGKAVRIVGDIVTGSVTASAGVIREGVTTVRLDTTDSYLKGLVTSYADPAPADTTIFAAGITRLSFLNGAQWIATGRGALANDLGAGSLTLGAGGGIDLASAWGSFAPGSVPSYAFRTLTIDSSDSRGASVTLADGATFTLLSDIRNGLADRIVFGPGISAFSASGTQRVKIAYDPVLDTTSWVTSAALRYGTTIAALRPISIVDASATTGSGFASVAGIISQWNGTYENALVRFSYQPIVSLSADGRQILLTGITLGGNGTAAPITYTTTLRGTAADTVYDGSSGAGGVRTYAFLTHDAIATEASGNAENFGVSVQGAGKTVLQVGSDGKGLLSVSTHRPATASWGSSTAISATGGAALVVNGATAITAQSDAYSSAALGVRVDQSTATFNGTTSITTTTPGFSQGLWARQSQLTVNGDLAVSTSASRAQTYAVYNSGGAADSLTVNGSASLLATGSGGSQDVAGIYNDNAGTNLAIAGTLGLTASSTGGAVYGVRNFGNVTTGGNAVLTVAGPSTAFGISNALAGAQTVIGGDLSLNLTNGSAIAIGLENMVGRNSAIVVKGGASIAVTSAGGVNAINNTGVIAIGNAGTLSSLRATTSCATCNVYGIRNDSGVVTIAGGLDVSATTTGSGLHDALWSMGGTDNASIVVNQAGGQHVRIDGDILSGTIANRGVAYEGSVAVRLDTADSYFSGRLLTPVDPNRADAVAYSTGTTQLSFLNGARWIATGTGTLTNDFGSGSLTLGAGGGVDMASSWGGFAPGAVPSYTQRTFVINSTAARGGSVLLNDGATFTVLSNILAGTADRIVFGSGISAFSASGTQHVRIAYDPVLGNTAWVNATTVKTGISIAASKAITIVDASAAAGGSATFANVAGLTSHWSGTYENALVQFGYTPIVSLSADKKTIQLTGITIGAGTAGSAPISMASVAAAAPAASQSPIASDAAAITSAQVSAATSPAIRPSDAVLTAQDATLAAVGNWQVTGMAALHDLDMYQSDRDAPAVVSSYVSSVSDFSGSGGYSRGIRQGFNQSTARSDRRSDHDGFRNYTGFSMMRATGRAGFDTGSGESTQTTLDMHSTWITDEDAFVSIVGRVTSIALRYQSINDLGHSGFGRTSVTASDFTLAGGFRTNDVIGLHLVPAASVNVGVFSVSGFTDSNGVAIRVKRMTPGSATVGLKLAHDFGTAVSARGSLYAKASVTQPFGTDTLLTASKDGGSFTPDSAGRRTLYADYRLGAMLRLDKKLRLSADGGRMTGTAISAGWVGQVAATFAF